MWLIALWVWGGALPAGEAAPAGAVEEPLEAEVEAAAEAETGVNQVPVRIYVRNEMSNRLRLVEARVVLDDIEVVHETARPAQELERSFSALETVVPPGDHALTATLVYVAKNAGPFNYLEGYRYRVQTVYPFSLDGVREPASLHLVARERRGPNLAPERRLVLEAMSTPGSGVTPLPGVTRASGQNVVRAPAP